MTVLLVAEQKNGTLNEVTARALTAAKQMGDAVHVLVLGRGAAEAAQAAAKLDGVGKVHVAEGGTLDNDLAEPVAALLVKLSDHHNDHRGAGHGLDQEHHAASRGAARRHAGV